MTFLKQVIMTTVFAIGSTLLWVLISSTSIATDGAKVFKKCKACHSFSKNKIGPSLKDIVDRKAGSVDGYRYSKGLKTARDSGLIWSVGQLDVFLKKPTTFMKKGGWGKTKMSFSGLRKGTDRQAVIEYMKNQ